MLLKEFFFYFICLVQDKVPQHFITTPTSFLFIYIQSFCFAVRYVTKWYRGKKGGKLIVDNEHTILFQKEHLRKEKEQLVKLLKI